MKSRASVAQIIFAIFLILLSGVSVVYQIFAVSFIRLFEINGLNWFQIFLILGYLALTCLSLYILRIGLKIISKHEISNLIKPNLCIFLFCIACLFFNIFTSLLLFGNSDSNLYNFRDYFAFCGATSTLLCIFIAILLNIALTIANCLKK